MSNQALYKKSLLMTFYDVLFMISAAGVSSYDVLRWLMMWCPPNRFNSNLQSTSEVSLPGPPQPVRVNTRSRASFHPGVRKHDYHVILPSEPRIPRRSSASPARMYRVPPARAWWPAVGAPVERGVRPQSHRCAGSLRYDSRLPLQTWRPCHE